MWISLYGDAFGQNICWYALEIIQSELLHEKQKKKYLLFKTPSSQKSQFLCNQTRSGR